MTTPYFPSFDCPLKKVAGGLERCAWAHLKAFSERKNISRLHELNSAYLGDVSSVMGRGLVGARLRVRRSSSVGARLRGMGRGSAGARLRGLGRGSLGAGLRGMGRGSAGVR